MGGGRREEGGGRREEGARVQRTPPWSSVGGGGGSVAASNASRRSETSVGASETSTCSTAQVFKLLDEYNREAGKTGGPPLKLPYLEKQNNAEPIPTVSYKRRTPATDCSSPFSQSATSSKR